MLFFPLSLSLSLSLFFCVSFSLSLSLSLSNYLSLSHSICLFLAVQIKRGKQGYMWLRDGLFLDEEMLKVFVEFK